MATDIELLELAAKAAGVEYDPALSKPHPFSRVWWGLWIKYHREPHELDRRYWNPLADDGDTLRLAVKLRIKSRYNEALGRGLAWDSMQLEYQANVEDCGRRMRRNPPRHCFGSSRLRTVAVTALALTLTTHPDKQAVRDWLKQQIAEHKPPESPEEVRRSLGWFLLGTNSNKAPECAR
jgi:hypothetical protein